MTTKPIDIALVMKTKDDEGRLLTRTLPDGRVVPDPVLTTRNYDVPDGFAVRFSLWDLDAENLIALMGGTPTDDEFQRFHSLQHDRMQEMVKTGHVEMIVQDHMQRRRIRELEQRVAKPSGPAAGND